MAKLLSERRGASRSSLNRADVHNCVDGETATALATSIDAFARDPQARVLVVTGGVTSPSVGATEARVHAHVARVGGARRAEGCARLDAGSRRSRAVNGYCFAGGFELAAWCDFRVAGAKRRVRCVEPAWGVPFTDGGTQRFARIMGRENALS